MAYSTNSPAGKVVQDVLNDLPGLVAVLALLIYALEGILERRREGALQYAH